MQSKSLVAVLILVILVLMGWGVYRGLSQVGNNQGYEPVQPILYSHKTHAGDNKIPCLYCHYGAERSRHAGIPADSVCMNCHKIILKDSPEIAKINKALEEKKPIEWVKVNRLADFVYFSHERHVGAGKIQCQTCHGPVETMIRLRQENTLSMGWCLDCHRQSDVVVQGTNKVVKESEIGGQDCAKCHY